MKSRIKIREWEVLFLIFIVIIALRIPYINASPFEQGGSWREGDTESIARNFVEYKFNIFYPQLNYDGPMPNYAELEFQITTFLIAVLYKFFGYHYFLARIVPLLFFIGSVYFMYLIAKKYYSVEHAYIASIIYGIIPLNIFFSRAIMPESAALFFFTGAFYFFSQWIEKERFYYIFIAALFTSMSILEKIPTIFVGIAMLAMAIEKYKAKLIFKWELYLFSIISLVLPFIYFGWLSSIAEYKFVNGIAVKHIIPEFYKAIFNKQAILFFRNWMPRAFTWYILVLSFVGFLIIIDVKKEFHINMWTFAMILELATIVAVIKFNYYLIFITPLLAIYSAKSLYYIFYNIKYGYILIIMIFILIGFTGWHEIRPYYVQQSDLLKQAEVVKKVTNKNDLIVVGTFDPALLNASDRKGWRANIRYYPFIPKNPPDELRYFIEHGAKYFVPLKGKIYNDINGEYIKYLNSHFKKIEVEKGYPIYRLQ